MFYYGSGSGIVVKVDFHLAYLLGAVTGTTQNNWFKSSDWCVPQISEDVIVLQYKVY